MTKGIVTCNLYRRKGKPSVNAERVGYFISGNEVDIKDVVLGETKNDYYDGIPTWYKLSGDIFIWSGGVSLNLGDVVLSKKILLDKTINEETDLEESPGRSNINIRDLMKSVFNEGNLLKAINYLNLIRVNKDVKISKGEGVAIGIIDAGVNKSHESLLNAFKNKRNDGIGNHGTLIASIIGSRNKTKLTGIAPESSLIDYKTYKQNGFSTKLMINSITNFIDLFSSNLSGKILNISLSLDKEDITDELEKIILEASKKIIIVASAGEVSNHELEPNSILQYPARLKRIISVGAIKEHSLNKQLILNSELDFLVPDIKLITAKKSDEYNLRRGKDSVATAIVTGVIGLLISSGKLEKFPTYENTISALNNIAMPIQQETKFTTLKIYKP